MICLEHQPQKTVPFFQNRYTWIRNNKEFNITTYIKGQTYQLEIKVFDVEHNFMRTTHTTQWLRLDEYLDSIFFAITGNQPQRNICEIFYDLYAKIGNINGMMVKSPLFARFHTEPRHDGSCSIHLIETRENNEMWLSCDTNMVVQIVCLRLDLNFRVKIVNYSTANAISLDKLKLLCDTNHRACADIFKWVYEKVSKFYVEIFSKKVQECLPISSSLINIMFEYLA